MIDTILNKRVPDFVDKGIGLVIGLIDEGTVRISGFGRFRDDRPDQPDGQILYEIGSTTKVFTATLLADMVTKGEVTLDQPVRELLPEVPTLPETITLLSLVTHTSGLPRLPSNVWKSVLKDRRNPYANYSEADLLDYLYGVKESQLMKTAGPINYSNLGMGLLGVALSRQLGLTYEEAIQKRICQPMGLQDTLVTLTPAHEKRLAQPHSGTGKPTSRFLIPALPGAGALLSTVADLQHFLQAHITQTGAFKNAISQSLQVRKTEFAPDFRLLRFYGKIRGWLDRNQQPEPEWLGIGLGWLRLCLPKSRTLTWMHDGATTGNRCFIAFAPQTQTGVIVLNNQGLSELELILPRYTIDNLGFELLEALNS